MRDKVFFRIATDTIRNIKLCGFDCCVVEEAMQYFNRDHDVENRGNIFSKAPLSMAQHSADMQAANEALEKLNNAVAELKESLVNAQSELDMQGLELFAASIQMFILVKKWDNQEELERLLNKYPKVIVGSQIIENPLINCFYYAGQNPVNPAPSRDDHDHRNEESYQYGVNLFMFAVSYGRMEICKFLLDRYGQEQCTHIDNSGNGIGQIAVLDTPNREMLQWLVSNGLVDTFLQEKSKKFPHNTLALSAAITGNTDAVYYILATVPDRTNDIVSNMLEYSKKVDSDITTNMANAYNALLKAAFPHGLTPYYKIDDNCGGNKWNMFDVSRGRKPNVSKKLEDLKAAILERGPSEYVLMQLWQGLNIGQLCVSVYIRDLLELTDALLSHASSSSRMMTLLHNWSQVSNLLRVFNVISPENMTNSQQQPVRVKNVQGQLQGLNYQDISSMMESVKEGAPNDVLKWCSQNIGYSANVTTAHRREVYSALLTLHCTPTLFAKCHNDIDYARCILHYSVLSERTEYIWTAIALYFKYPMNNGVILESGVVNCENILCSFLGYNKDDSSSYDCAFNSSYMTLVNELVRQHEIMQAWSQEFVVWMTSGEVDLIKMFVKQMDELLDRAKALKVELKHQKTFTPQFSNSSTSSASINGRNAVDVTPGIPYLSSSLVVI